MIGVFSGNGIFFEDTDRIFFKKELIFRSFFKTRAEPGRTSLSKEKIIAVH